MSSMASVRTIDGDDGNKKPAGGGSGEMSRRGAKWEGGGEGRGGGGGGGGGDEAKGVGAEAKGRRAGRK